MVEVLLEESPVRLVEGKVPMLLEVCNGRPDTRPRRMPKRARKMDESMACGCGVCTQRERWLVVMLWAGKMLWV